MKTWPMFISIGLIGLCFYFIIAVIGVWIIIGIGSENFLLNGIDDAGISIFGVCTPIVFVPSILLFILGWSGFKKDEELHKLASLLIKNQKMSITELAKELNKSESETEMEVFESINEGLVQGYIEPGPRIFIVTNIPAMGVPDSNSNCKN